MRYFYALIWAFLCGSPVDLYIQRRYSNIDSPVSIERLWEDQKRKRLKKKYKNRKYMKRRPYRLKHYSIKGQHSKDSRYSNQRTLRRMYRNA